MFLLYVIIGLVIFAFAGIIFQVNKKLIYRRAVHQRLKKDVAGQQLQMRIINNRNQALRSEILKLEKQIITDGFKNALPANVTVKRVIETVENRLKNKDHIDF